MTATTTITATAGSSSSSGDAPPAALVTLPKPVAAASSSRCSVRRCMVATLVLMVFAPLFLAYHISTAIIYPPFHAIPTGPGRFARLTPERRQFYIYTRDPLTDLGYMFEEVHFASCHDPELDLSAWIIPCLNQPCKRAVVLMHGAGNDRRQTLRFATFLVPNGYTVMLVDAREHGKSGSRRWGISYGFREHQDILCSVRYLRETHAQIEKVAVMGLSQGAASSLLAASYSSDISAVVAESPFASVEGLVQDVLEMAVGSMPKWSTANNPVMQLVDSLTRSLTVPQWFFDLVNVLVRWRLPKGVENAQDRIAFVRQPVLIMHSEMDQLVRFHHGVKLFQLASSPHKEFWAVSNAEHCSVYNANRSEYGRRVLEFLDKHLSTPERTAAGPAPMPPPRESTNGRRSLP